MIKVKYTSAWAILSLLIMLVFTGCASIEKAESLHREGEKQKALEMAVSLLEDDSSKVRLRAVKLVGKIGGPQAGAALHQRLVESNARVLSEIIRNLGKIQYEPALESFVLLRMLSGLTEKQVQI